MSLLQEDPTSGKRTQSIQIVNGRVSHAKIQGRVVPIIRGDLEPKYFKFLFIPPYQREAMRGVKHDELFDALALDGIGVPDDLLLCVRTSAFTPLASGVLALPARGLLVLDGHQRVAAAKRRLAEGLTTDDFGVKVFIGTTPDEENATFYQVNRLHTDVSTDVFLRNMGDNDVIRTLRELSENTEGFPQIGWSQRPMPGDVIKAQTLFSVAIMLHGFKASSIEELTNRMDKTTKRVGNELLGVNVRTFFSIVQEYFVPSKLGDYAYRADFLRGLALFFSKYTNFWDSKKPLRLAGKVDDLKKLTGAAKLTVERDLAMTGAVAALEDTLKRHFDSGRSDAGKLVDKTWEEV